jgi:8-oxo-dGTP diphosphatase
MKHRTEKSRVPILAAGGIVLRYDRDLMPCFAIVQSRKLATWGLPKGKLAGGEDAMTAARREVLEETGQHVTVHEFLGTLVYEASSRPKVIQFWRMEAVGESTGDLMHDVVAVDWLTLDDAINRLSHLRERVFLEQVGPIALRQARRPAGADLFRERAVTGIVVAGVPLAPTADVSLAGHAGAGAFVDRTSPPPFDQDLAGRPAPALVLSQGAQAVSSAGTDAAGRNHNVKIPVEKDLVETGLDGKALIKKTWGWFRHAALLHRQPLD